MLRLRPLYPIYAACGRWHPRGRILFEDNDGQTYHYGSGNGLWQAEIDPASGNLAAPIEKSLDKKQPGRPEWMIGGIVGPFVIKRDGVYCMCRNWASIR